MPAAAALDKPLFAGGGNSSAVRTRAAGHYFPAKRTDGDDTNLKRLSSNAAYAKLYL
jgi:hypothetical protein